MKYLNLLFLIMNVAALAGSPIHLYIDGAPISWDPDQPFIYQVESGILNQAVSADQAHAWTLAEFADWNTVEGSRLQINEGSRIDANIQSAEQLNDLLALQVNPILFDEDGSLMQELGLGSNVLGITHVSPPKSGKFYQSSYVIINGSALSEFTESGIRHVMLHEFGHMIGLAHSVVNGDLRWSDLTYEDFGQVPVDAVEIMYYQVSLDDEAFANHDLKSDDISGLLGLYGSASGERGSLMGTVKLPDGALPAKGVNVIARDRSGGSQSVFTKAASVLSGVGGEGDFRITGLPPGSYTVELQDIAGSNSGVYWREGIRTDNPNSRSLVIGAFPGDPEFYNGSSESNDPSIDDPEQFELLQIEGEQTISKLDFIMNRSAALKGSSMSMSYVLPETRSLGDGITESYIGIVNPGQAELALELFGFAKDGAMLEKASNQSIGPGQKLWLTLPELFPGQHLQIDWVQVGCNGELLVFAEQRLPGTRSAYWASPNRESGAIVPHIAADSNNIESVLSAVNVGSTPANIRLTNEPSGETITVVNPADPYTKKQQVIADLLGDDLGPSTWASLESNAVSLALMESFIGLPDRKEAAVISLNQQSGNSLRFLHVAQDVALYWTGMIYIQAGQTPSTVEETFFAADGSVLSSNCMDEVAPGQKITLLFSGQSQQRVPSGTSWIEVKSGQPLVGYTLYGTAAGSVHDIFAGVQGAYETGRLIEYAHLQTGEHAFTALVAVNTGDETADITFAAMSNCGEVLEEKTIAGVAPHVKIARLLGSGPDPLFNEPETLAQASWVRARSTGSQWAGFQLWGDQRVPNLQFLSGINAKTRPGPQQGIVAESEPNNTYLTAQELQSGEDWHINVVGTISLSEQGPLINTDIPDDIEDIYTITLTERTPLLIAVSPEEEYADLDLYVFNSPYPSGNFLRPVTYLDPNVNVAADLGGDESIAGIFEPGTYYILVSQYDYDFVDRTDYGLLISSRPLLLETFEDGLEEWDSFASEEDSDGISGWHTLTEAFASKHGSALENRAAVAGETEASLIFSPPITIPDTGLTLFDFNLAYAAEGDSLTDPLFQFGYLNDELEAFAFLKPLPDQIPTEPLDSNGQSYSWIPWVDWVSWAGNSIDDNRLEHSFLGQEGRTLALMMVTGSNQGRLLIDNIRAFNIQTTAQPGKSKRTGVVKGNRKGKRINRSRHLRVLKGQ